MPRTTTIEGLLERLLVPPVGDIRPVVDASSAGDPTTARIDDFRRVVAVVAATAVGFFIPSLILAQVPTSHWLPFIVAAALAGLWIGGSFYVVPEGSTWAVFAAGLNAAIIGGLAVLYQPYYHELGLLFALIVGGHAIVHGIRSALVAAVIGGAVVPYVVQAGQPVNPSDPFYSFIYLSGLALIPWTATRLARHRAAAFRHQLSLTLATEREAVMILARAAEAKDHVTGDHVLRVGDLSAEIGRRAGMSIAEAEDLRFAGMLHDVGKLHLPDQLLMKPGPLTSDEWDEVRKHTIWGERILGASEGFELARRVCRSHHENWDGSGYPDRLKAMDIPFAARIVRLADVFDALRSERPYKDAWDIARCLEEIERGAGRLFDPDLSKELIALFDGEAITLGHAASARAEPVEVGAGA
jgi:putative two-component system response regulator